MATLQLRCPHCKQLTPHRTKGPPENHDGFILHRLVCAFCGTVTIAPAEDFPNDIDPDDKPDYGTKSES